MALFHLYFCASFIQSSCQLSFLCADLFGQSNNSMRRKSSFVQFVKSINPNFIQLQKLLRRNLLRQKLLQHNLRSFEFILSARKVLQGVLENPRRCKQLQMMKLQKCNIIPFVFRCNFYAGRTTPFSFMWTDDIKFWNIISQHCTTERLEIPISKYFCFKTLFSIQIFCEHWLYGL